VLMGSLCYMFLYESCHYHNHHWNCIYVCDGFTVDIVFMCLIVVVFMDLCFSLYEVSGNKSNVRIKFFF